MHRRFQRQFSSHENRRKVVLAGLATLEDEADNVIRKVEMHEKRRCST
jgi:hypothetical protein